VGRKPPRTRLRSRNNGAIDGDAILFAIPAEAPRAALGVGEPGQPVRRRRSRLASSIGGSASITRVRGKMAVAVVP